MSAGVPLYLVSACGTAEEFVAAFRRYADRTGLFVPVAEPLPAGRRGRIALALKDGGVMIAGEAEVVASSARPSGIHARVGMTLKWVEPDEPSKTVIAELEKARLAMKPAPPTVPPRPADIPAEPRPVPPAPGGRIDAANALAECVLIGDPATFTSAAIPSGPAGKFIIPSIPTTNRAPKPPTTPPALTRPRTPSAQIPVIKPITPPAGVAAKPEMKPAADAMPVLATPVGGVPAPKPTTPSGGTRTLGAEPVAPIPPTPSGGVPAPVTPGSSGEMRATTLGVPPLTRGPKLEDKMSRATRIGFPALKLPAMEAPAVIVAIPPKDDPPGTTGSPFKRATPPQPMAAVAPRPAGPPMPRQPTPFTPLPIVRLPAVEPAVDPEQTDLTDMPLPASDEPRSLGVAIVTAVAPEASEPTRQEPPLSSTEIAAAEASGPPIEPAAGTRSGGMRASELMAAIGGGDDWTMSPDAPAPTILPTRTVEMATSTRPTEPISAAGLAAIEKPPEPVVPEPPGDWTMSADPTADGGWSPPSKVDIPPFPDAPKGNRVVAIASAEPLNAVEWEDKPTGIGEPLVEIDPSLLSARVSEPAIVPLPPPLPAPPMVAMPPPLPMGMPGAIPTPAPGTLTMPPGVPPPLGPMPPVMTPSMSAFGPTGPVQPLFPPGVIPTPLPGALRASEQMPMFGGPLPPSPMESTSLLEVPRSHRNLLIAIGVVVVLAAAAAIAVLGFGVGRGRAKTQTAHGAAAIGSGASEGSARTPAVAGGDAVVAGSNVPAVETPTPTVDAGPSLCNVDVATLPVGAEIWVDDAQLGVTPTTVHLPCGVEAKLQLKKARLQMVRTITPGTDTSVVVKLVAPAVPTVSMRVTSNPPGATITMGGRVLGITPTTIHLPAGGASLTLTKEGYAPSTEHVAPKPNGTNFVTLKRRTR